MNYKLDLQKIADELEFDLEDVEMLIEVFLESVTESLQSLNNAIMSNDYEAILYSAHSIKGSAANLTLMHISELARTIEYHARAKDAIEYNKFYDELKKYINDIK
ncbi:MAG: Hpt domain-containing protein [Arcobacteraceae bacterium]